MQDSTALVMMDNRPPDLSQIKFSRNVLTLDFQAKLVAMLTAYLNARYACRHGYTMLFYQMDSQGCSHPLWGARHPSYCKLAAIGDALAAGYGWVVFLDTDAFIRTRDPLPALLRRYGASGTAFQRPADGSHGDGVPMSFFGWDHPCALC